MTTTSQLIADNLARVRERIADAAVSSSRKADEIQLVAVTKYVGPAESKALLDAGCVELGESRPQQLWEKAEEQSLASAHWHQIGHLQRNKVQRTLPLVTLIHSVDSLRLLKTIDRTATQLDRHIKVLLELNCSGDAKKHGLSGEGLKALLPELPNFEHVNVCGLMTMASRKGGVAVARSNFAALRELRDLVASECAPVAQLTELSMGMSHDFEEAIREGATIVRIGSLLFDGISP